MVAVGLRVQGSPCSRAMVRRERGTGWVGVGGGLQLARQPGDRDGGGLVVYVPTDGSGSGERERLGTRTGRGIPEGGPSQPVSQSGATGYRYWLTRGVACYTSPIDSAEAEDSIVYAADCRASVAYKRLYTTAVHLAPLQRTTSNTPAVPVGQGWKLPNSGRKQARSRQIEQSKAALTLDWERSLGRMDTVWTGP
ncbi:hypothetical protein CIB48_g8009 [Xylaria polymorpha]|nr:hypothetical protein CIB48_g8009 [Xylaria polymorpha]